MTRKRLLVLTGIFFLVVLTLTLIPRHSDLWLRICIRDQDWERLKDVQLTMSDVSQKALVATTLELHTDYENGVKQLCGIAGWYSDVAQRILDASQSGLTVAIESSHCKRKEFALSRKDIKSVYELPGIQLGGHGTGYRPAAMHYRFSYKLDLDCRFQAGDVELLDEGERLPTAGSSGLTRASSAAGSGGSTREAPRAGASGRARLPRSARMILC